MLAIFFILSNPLNFASAVANVRELATRVILTPDVVSVSGGSGGTLTFPNVMLEVEELKRLPPIRTLASIVRVPALSVVGLAAFALLAALLFPSLVRLESLPIATDLFRARDGEFAPHVRVSVFDLGVDGGDDLGHTELTRLNGDLGLEHDLEEQVSQLFTQSRAVLLIYGYQRLVCLLQ